MLSRQLILHNVNRFCYCKPRNLGVSLDFSYTSAKIRKGVSLIIQNKVSQSSGRPLIHHKLRRGALGFSVLRFWPFFRSVFRFLHRKTSVFRFWCMLRFAVLPFLAFVFRFSAKIQAVFRIWYPIWFSVFPIWFPVMRLNRVGGRASRITPGTLTSH